MVGRRGVWCCWTKYLNRMIETVRRLWDSYWVKPNPLTDFLGAHGLVSNTILMDFHFSRQSLSVQGRANKRLRHFDGSPAFNFHQASLFNNISHFLLLLFSFVRLFLEIVDLPHSIVKTMTIWWAVGHGANESSLWIFKRLNGIYVRWNPQICVT